MIEGTNIQLRAVELSDVELLYSWENDMTLWPVSNTLVPFSRYQLEKYVKSASLDLYQTRQLRLIIECKTSTNNGKAAGLIDLFDFDPFHNRAGLGIYIHIDYREKGMAKEALKLFMEYAFSVLGIHNLYCNVAQSNSISIQLFTSLGFNPIGIKKSGSKLKTGTRMN